MGESEAKMDQLLLPQTEPTFCCTLCSMCHPVAEKEMVCPVFSSRVCAYTFEHLVVVRCVCVCVCCFCFCTTKLSEKRETRRKTNAILLETEGRKVMPRVEEPGRIAEALKLLCADYNLCSVCMFGCCYCCVSL